MANAIPVHSDKTEQPKVEAPKPVKSAKPVDHSEFIGKDHPEFGTWFGRGWRKDS